MDESKCSPPNPPGQDECSPPKPPEQEECNHLVVCAKWIAGPWSKVY